MTITNVPTPGAPIRSDWAQSITNECNNLLVHKAGETMTGTLSVGQAANPTQSTPGLTLTGTGDLGRIVSAVSAPTAPLTANIAIDRSGTAGAANARFVSFTLSGAGTANVVGSITVATGSSVAYNTTSDARLKERTGDVADALDSVAALGALAYRGRWIADQGAGKEWVFVNAQDVEPVAPFAVTGDPDGLDDDGTIIPQQLDHGALVPLLLAAVSQLTDRVAALEAAR